VAFVDDSKGDGSCNGGFAGALGILDEGKTAGQRGTNGRELGRIEPGEMLLGLVCIYCNTFR